MAAMKLDANSYRVIDAFIFSNVKQLRNFPDHI